MMQTDGRTQSYGRRETTLIGYAPAPPTARPEVENVHQDIAPPVTYVASDQQVTAPNNESAENLVANLAGTLEPAVEPVFEAAPPAAELVRPIAFDDVRPLAPADRRNPLSRRLPINRGRHLSRAFFEEGERQEQAGWENSPLASDSSSFGQSSVRLGFSSFDRVPRKRAPMIAAAAGIGMAAAILGAWAFGLWSPRGTAKAPTDVWSALRVPGAGWQPAAITTTTAPPVAVQKPSPAPTPAPVKVAPPPAKTPPAFAPTADTPKAPAPKAAPAPTKPRPPVARVVAPVRRQAPVARRVPPRPALTRPAPTSHARVKALQVAAPTAGDSVDVVASPEAPAPASTLPPASEAPEPPPAAESDPSASP